MSFKKVVGSILRAIGLVAGVAKPIVTAAFPEVGSLYTVALSGILSVEALLGGQSGNGAAKLEQLAATLIPFAQAWAAKHGMKWTDDQIKLWASAVVDTMKLLPDLPNPVPLTPPDAVE